MFENRVRKKRINTLLIVVVFVLLVAFGFGYYLNSGGNAEVGKDTQKLKDTSDYQIPDSIKSSAAEASAMTPEANPGLTSEDSTDANSNKDNFITPNTKVIFKTYFTLCSHMVDREPEDGKALINLSEASLRNRYPEWKINEFSSKQVILRKEIQTYCPRHFIIGAKDGFIAIYVYNSEGKKVMHELTDYPTSVLTTEDQKNLEYGIVADTEEELQQKLEGLSD